MERLNGTGFYFKLAHVIDRYQVTLNLTVFVRTTCPTSTRMVPVQSFLFHLYLIFGLIKIFQVQDIATSFSKINKQYTSFGKSFHASSSSHDIFPHKVAFGTKKKKY